MHHRLQRRLEMACWRCWKVSWAVMNIPTWHCLSVTMMLSLLTNCCWPPDVPLCTR